MSQDLTYRIEFRTRGDGQCRSRVAAAMIGQFLTCYAISYLFESCQKRRGMAGNKMWINFLQRSVPFARKKTGQKRDKNQIYQIKEPSVRMPCSDHVFGHLDAFMPQQFTHHIKIGAQCKKRCRCRMTAAMEGDMLVNLAILHPFL